MADDKNRSYRLQLNVCWLLFFRPRPLDHYYCTYACGMWEPATYTLSLLRVVVSLSQA